MSFLKRVQSVWYPDRYHGWGLTRRYFEGWYFKMVSADGKHALAVIPGISMPESGEPQAFIQVMDGVHCKATYHRFPVDQFQPASQAFEVRIGNNYFSDKKVVLDLPGLSGEVHFTDTQPWPKMLGAPGIMGWYSFVPLMECNHGVVSLNHGLAGRLMFEGEVVQLEGGKGYIEKDWGRSFPKAYVWMQSNHFEGSDRASLMASVAHIPWLNNYFIGFISGFWLDGKLHKFATYTGARKRLVLTDDQVSLGFQTPGAELSILARQAPGTALRSPVSGEMTGKIQESLQAELQVELRLKGQRIFEGVGKHAGLEVAGETSVLL